MSAACCFFAADDAVPLVAARVRGVAGSGLSRGSPLRFADRGASLLANQPANLRGGGLEL